MIEQFYDLKPQVLELDRKTLELCRDQFAHLEEIRDYNQLKMLRAFTDCGVEARHFLGSTGYGVWDDSRNKLEEVFSRCMGAEDALVRPQFMSGTHTLTVALFGLLRAGDTLLAATGRPYDTLEGVIGIGEAGKGCRNTASITMRCPCCRTLRRTMPPLQSTPRPLPWCISSAAAVIPSATPLTWIPSRKWPIPPARPTPMW